jgi:hypothetical protein
LAQRCPFSSLEALQAVSVSAKILSTRVNVESKRHASLQQQRNNPRNGPESARRGRTCGA